MRGGFGDGQRYSAVVVLQLRSTQRRKLIFTFTVERRRCGKCHQKFIISRYDKGKVPEFREILVSKFMGNLIIETRYCRHLRLSAIFFSQPWWCLRCRVCLPKIFSILRSSRNCLWFLCASVCVSVGKSRKIFQLFSCECKCGGRIERRLAFQQMMSSIRIWYTWVSFAILTARLTRVAVAGCTKENVVQSQKVLRFKMKILKLYTSYSL